MAKLVVNVPNRPKGSNISVPGLGIFENGKEHEVSPEVRKKFEARGKNMPKVIGVPMKEEPGINLDVEVGGNTNELQPDNNEEDE